MRFRFRRLTAVALLLLFAARPGVAETDPGPPETKPANASYPSASVGFPAGGLSFPSGSVSFSAATIAAPAAALASDAMSMKEEKGGIRFTLNADLLFDFDKADLRPAADPVLADLVAQVQARIPGGRFRVEGHTDAKGNDRYNDSLSNRRAKSVQAWLTRRGGIPAARITTTGFGKRRPVAPNQKSDGSDDPEGRQKNRRVEILVVRG